MAVNNQFNPETAAVEVAECIKTKINTYSVTLECALESLEHFDEKMKSEKWDALVAKYNADETKNVISTNKDTWTIHWEEIVINKTKSVGLTEEEKLINSGN